MSTLLHICETRKWHTGVGTRNDVYTVCKSTTAATGSPESLIFKMVRRSTPPIMPNFKRVFSRLSCRTCDPPPVGQHGDSFDPPRPIPVGPRSIPLGHVQVTVKMRCLPVLPPEVWRVIFRFATEDDTRFTPIEFPAKTADTNDISFLHLSHSHSDRDARLERYLRSIKEKHNIVKVCRQWSIIALEVLYECIWIYRPAQAHALAQAICEKDSGTSKIRGPRKGHYIKRLHIETPIRERCSPNDLCVIVDNAPHLENFMDCRSVCRSVHGSSNSDPASATQLLYAITQAESLIRCLSWTNYDDMSLHLHLSHLLANVASKLEFLELTFCNMDIHSLKEPLRGYPGLPLTLPHLHALKLCLHNATLGVLATWDLPIIRNVSIVAADFSYAGEGFCNFFRTHGKKLKQLELAHSPSIIEDYYLTIPVDPQTTASRSIHLSAWCPNLEEFICSADTEWNWQSSDWIVPHPLLPSHPNLRLIGIRDLDKRMRDEISICINPFRPLLSQIRSLLCYHSFPKLRVICDMSFESNIMRSEPYSEAVINFWSQVAQLCKDEGVQLEDYARMNAVMACKDIVHAQVREMLHEKAQETHKKLCWQRRNPLHHLARLISIAT